MILIYAQVWEPLVTEKSVIDIEGISDEQRDHKIWNKPLKKYMFKHKNVVKSVKLRQTFKGQ